jgi:hypothetical protein
MRVWAINWADICDVKCIRDDGIELDDLAQPNGVLLMDINDIATVHKMAQDDIIAMNDGEDTGDEWELMGSRSSLDDNYRVYRYGDDTLMICVLKEVL